MPYKDKEKRKEYNTLYYKTQPKLIRNDEQKLKNAQSTREWRERNPLKSIWASAKARAKRLGQEFTINPEDIIIPEVCPILQIPLYRSNYRQSGNSPALDRIDNKKGYTKGNVSVISHKANLFKGDMTVGQVERLLLYMKGEI